MWLWVSCCCCCLVMSSSLRAHGLQLVRLPSSSLSPGVTQTYIHFESVMSSKHLIISHPLLLPSIFASITVFSNESVLHIRWPNYWSFTSASVLPMNIQDWFPLEWTGWISLQSKGLSRVFSNTTVQSINTSVLRFLYSPALISIHDYWRNHRFDYVKLCWQSNVSAFNMLSRLVITFLLRSKHLLISWIQSPSAVILEPKEIKPVTVSTVSPSICHEVMGPGAMILVF